MAHRKLLFPVLAAAALAGCADDPIAPVAPISPSLSVAASGDGAGTYLVRFKGNGVPKGFAATVERLGGEVIFSHAVGIAAVAGLDDAGAAKLAATSNVAAVDADAYTTLENPTVTNAEVADVSPNSPTAPATAFFFGRQWHLRAIDAPAAWAAGKLGDESVKVGILDTGIDYRHPDLAGRVDLTLSRSFVPSDDAYVRAYFPGAHPIADLHYHGTHVAATVASNALAAAGVTSQTTLVGLKVCNVFGQCPTSGTLAAILYAADAGLPIINMSLGGAFNRRDASARGGNGPSFLATINHVMNYANRKGTTIVVSAGNDAIDMDHNGNEFITYCDATHVVCVSATGPTASVHGTDGPWTNVDAPAGYSNFGRSGVSVAAPGGTSAGAVHAACSGFSLQIPTCQTGTYVLGLTGTSMAAPHASGVAALIASEGTRGAALRARLMQTADDLGQPGVDPAYGKGRVNAARAAGVAAVTN